LDNYVTRVKGHYMKSSVVKWLLTLFEKGAV
jgi:hypothetical protein